MSGPWGNSLLADLGAPEPEVVIVLARCSVDRQGFGMRYARLDSRVWSLTWAFAIKERVASREGYDRTTIRGEFVTSSEYPGCPHCGRGAFFRCGCGRVACWDGESRSVTCPWCGSTGELSGVLSSLEGGGDR